jgi:hypothetical protein
VLAVLPNVNLGHLMVIQFQSSFSLALRGGKWSTLHPGSFNRKQEPMVFLGWKVVCVSGPVCSFGEEKFATAGIFL